MSGTAARRRLESRAAESLKQDGWFTDVTIPSVKIYKGNYVSNRHDFFNVFDLIALHPDRMPRFIQITSAGSGVDPGQTIRSHKQKIEDALPYIDTIKQEIWVYMKLKNGRWGKPLIFFRTKLYGWEVAEYRWEVAEDDSHR
jgi:hypothetical protein